MNSETFLQHENLDAAREPFNSALERTRPSSWNNPRIVIGKDFGRQPAKRTIGLAAERPWLSL